MDYPSNVVLDAIDFTPDTLMNAEIFGDDDKKIGKVSHVHGMGSASQIVVDVGGFLGIGTRSVMIPVKRMAFMRDDNGRVNGLTSWTKAQVMAFPEYKH